MTGPTQHITRNAPPRSVHCADRPFAEVANDNTIEDLTDAYPRPASHTRGNTTVAVYTPRTAIRSRSSPRRAWQDNAKAPTTASRSISLAARTRAAKFRLPKTDAFQAARWTHSWGRDAAPAGLGGGVWIVVVGVVGDGEPGWGCSCGASGTTLSATTDMRRLEGTGILSDGASCVV